MVEKEIKSILEEELLKEEVNTTSSEPKDTTNKTMPSIETCQAIDNQGGVDEPYCSCGCGALWSYEGDFCPSCQTECR